jgi:PBP1b-binding outer membrane lipoprotein LpoB
MKTSIKIIALLMLGLLFASACSNNELEKQHEFEKCTAVCASVLEGDFVTLELCRRECKQQFLEE